METEKNLILYLPFDDPDDYNKAFDYSKSRVDGTLSEGATFTRNAKKAKALSLNGSGICDVAKDIPFSSDFTLCLWVKSATKELGWMLNFSGIENYIEQWLDVLPGKWEFLSFVKRSTLFTVYLNGTSIYTKILSGTPIGFSINDSKVDGGSYACLDELKLYSIAKTQTEIMKIQADNTDVEYYVDGTSFKSFGVYVSKSTGIIGGLQKKDGLSVDYDDYHGVVVDKKRPRYKERTISLECFIEASSKAAFVEWANLFISKFDKSGNTRLSIEFSGYTRPLVYEVDRPNETDIEKTWNDELMVGTFTLKLRECEPVKRVLRWIGTGTATIKVTTAKMLNIYWGDGSYNYDVSGTNTEVTHEFTTDGVYDIIITGVIEDIKSFETNCIVIWNKLQ